MSSTSEPDEEVRLHDAGLVNGRTVALVTARRGSNPDDTDERLLLLDLETSERTDLGSVGGWESGLSHARLAGSRIVTVLSAGAQSFLIVRGIDGAIEWQAPDSVVDARVSVAVVDDEVILLQPGFDGEGLRPRLGVDRYDLATGARTSSQTLSLRPTEGVGVEAGFCSYAEAVADRLICDRSSAGPIEIDESGVTASAARTGGGRVTLPRGSVTGTPSEEPASVDESCDGLDGTEPVVGGHALTAIPDGFERDGEVSETSTGFVDMGGETHARLRFSDADGRWIEFDSFGMGSPETYAQELHTGAVSERVTYVRCVNPGDAQPIEYQATLSHHPDRTILAAQEWEYGGFSISGSPDVTVEELLAVASGLRGAPPAA